MTRRSSNGLWPCLLYTSDIYKTAIAYVRQPIERFGTEALDLLIKSIEQRDKPGSCTRIVLTPEIVESLPEEALRSAEEAVTEA